LWFTEDAGRIGRITTSGAITEFAIPTSQSATVGIVAGLDGALWFTETSNQLGRITTSGIISEFPIAMPGSGPGSITVGPDGALWLVQPNTGQIARAVLANNPPAVITYPTSQQPYSVTTGPDGAIWFTTNLNTLGRITTSGGLVEYRPSTFAPSITP